GDPGGGRDRDRSDRVGSIVRKTAGVLRSHHRHDHERRIVGNKEMKGLCRSSARGSAAVEFALVLPLLLVVGLALLQVGLLTKDQLIVQEAARAGARQAAVSNDDGSVRQ